MYTIYQAAVMFPVFPEGEIVLHNFPVGFTKVAKVKCTDPEEAFALTNHIRHPWQANPQVTALVGEARSTSVGDVILTPDGCYLYVCAVGLQELRRGAGNTLSATLPASAKTRLTEPYALCVIKFRSGKVKQELFRALAPSSKPTLEQQLWDFVTFHCKRLPRARFEQAKFIEYEGTRHLHIPTQATTITYRAMTVTSGIALLNQP